MTMLNVGHHSDNAECRITVTMLNIDNVQVSHVYVTTDLINVMQIFLLVHLLINSGFINPLYA